MTRFFWPHPVGATACPSVKGCAGRTGGGEQGWGIARVPALLSKESAFPLVEMATAR